MKIKALKLSGFKSFVEPTELKIRDGLTGVVGPNGCGKSNLLEAIRWVMGESSPKSMRSGGMEDVIFAGTESRPARNFAEVTLNAEISVHENALMNMGGNVRDNFDDAKDDQFSGTEDLEIIRRIERGAGSAYRANSRDVRAKDIALIFADAATGAHSPALVSQGRISNIISAKPAQRREMLEEAAGISGLHVRRKDAEQKLRAAERNLERLDTILSDMEARSGHLKRQARAAEKYRKLTDQIAQAEARLIYVRWKNAKQEADLAKAQSKEAEGKVEQAQKQNDALSLAHQEAAKQLANDRAEAMASRDATAAKNETLIKLKSQYDRVTDQKRDFDKQAQIIDNDMRSEDRLTHDAGDALSRLKSVLKELETQIVDSDTARPNLSKHVENLEQSNRVNEVALANAIAKHARAQAEYRVAEAAYLNAQNSHDKLEKSYDQLLRQEAQLPSDESLKIAIETANSQAAVHQNIIEKSKKIIIETEEKRRKLEDQYNEQQSHFADINAQHSALESEAKALQKSLSSYQGDDKAIAKMQAQKGFEHALAAALGEDAEAQIGGEKGRRWTVKIADTQSIKRPNISGAICLADHVDAPPELMARLSHIWVVDDDDGRILPTGHRIVTRSGIMRRWDGFISDGDGSMTAQYLIRNNRLNAIMAQIPEYSITIKKAQNIICESQENLAKMQEDIGQARQQRDTSENAMRIAMRESDSAENALQRLQDQKAQISDQMSQIKTELSSAKETLAITKEERSVLSDAQELQHDVDVLRSTSSTLRSQALSAQSALSAHDQAASALRERKAGTTAEIRGWQQRAGEADKRIAAMKQRAKDIDEMLKSLTDEPRKLEQKIAITENEKQTAHDNLTRNQEKERASENALKSLEHIISQASEELASAREMRAAALAKTENQEQRRIEMGRISGERFECPPPLLPEKMHFDETTLRETSEESAALEKFQQERERIGPVNLVAADELTALEKEQIDGRAESEELIQAINQLRGSIGSLNREGRARLRAAFTAVDEHFRRLFSILFNGGAAHLELIDSDDPLEAGLEIMAQPPGKRLSSLTLLSGGEQALTAVALIFGLFLTNPAPICVLDEVDAPLDDANIERFCDLLDAMVKETETRYLIVTHNAVTMSRMHRLYGVTMIEQGVSRLVSVDLGGAVELLDNV